ncbi:MSMEG_1061 family FMN-dependent PPOX-type flavoprotein [Mangrovicoccus sp. HB161399]|uniref:MSMEG_1061 family FMN-dependent PPOX-type flavoprotein n=1 Tax=Mangrovicoccus sp. HB161399 TaxID=2720392 RepID=UPI001553B5AE|nr:MSMEG_1061 family FMN-dependent PPOX-type flavoprotein [Mangrovicoccus sp. HB161399]
MTFRPEETVRTRARLREIIPEQDSVRVLQKDLDRLNRVARDFIALSPFLVLATSGRRGRVSVSPRGDRPGFVEVHDDRTLLIPDRLGNQRLDCFENILDDPRVGLIFLVPGHPETLRISGTAAIVRDSAAQARLAHGGREPALILAVRAEQVFMHCAKAFLRSRLWQAETWPARRTAPSLAQWVSEAVPSELTEAEIQEIHDEDAATRLY